jgi:cytochrome d ubiquinol oxidase subunit II
VSLPLVAAGVIGVTLTLYVVLAGADFGGGVWDLLASGPRAQAQRATIEHAIGPIWEPNHVWLIFAVVLLFTAFPAAFAGYLVALHIPITIGLVGIMLRGTAFAFRSYGAKGDAEQRRWGRVFAVASTITPVMLGVCVGAAASGRATLWQGVPSYGFLYSWLAPFPFVVGAFTLALFSFLAAVYLTLETTDADVREDFRRRALGAAVAAGAAAFVALAMTKGAAPLLWHSLMGGLPAYAFQALTGLAAVGTIAALVTRRYRLARVLAPLQVALVLWGWLGAQYPYVVVPDLTIDQAAAPDTTLRLALGTVAIGSLLLVPSFYYLFRVMGKMGGKNN